MKNGVAIQELFEVVGKPTRKQVLDMEVMIAECLPPVDLPVRHFFSDGVYARELSIPAGTVLTGKIHKYTNLNILSKGEISVLTEDGIKRVSAPFTVVSPPGTKRIAYAHTDCIWTTVHGTTETDLGRLEEHFVCDTDEQYLAFVDTLKIEEK